MRKTIRAFPIILLVFIMGSMELRSEETTITRALQKARTLAKKKQYTEAVVFLKEQFGKTEDTELLLELAVIYNKSKQKDRAVATLDDMIDRIRRQDKVTLYDRGLFEKANSRLCKLNRNRKALLKINAKVSKQFLRLAESCLKKHDPATFQTALKRVDKIEPRNPGADGLRDVYAHGGKTPGKWRDLTKIQHHDVHNAKGPEGRWFAINRFPRVKSKWIRTMKATELFTKGRKWIVLHPQQHQYQKDKKNSYIEYRLPKAITEFKGQVTIAHLDKGAIEFIVWAGEGDKRHSAMRIWTPIKGRRPAEFHLKFPPTFHFVIEVQAKEIAKENIGVILDPMVR